MLSLLSESFPLSDDTWEEEKGEGRASLSVSRTKKKCSREAAATTHSQSPRNICFPLLQKRGGFTASFSPLRPLSPPPPPIILISVFRPDSGLIDRSWEKRGRTAAERNVEIIPAILSFIVPHCLHRGCFTYYMEAGKEASCFFFLHPSDV